MSPRLLTFQEPRPDQATRATVPLPRHHYLDDLFQHSSVSNRIFPPEKAVEHRDLPRKTTNYAVSDVAIHYCILSLDNVSILCSIVAIIIN
jgi:hypothetical protein